MKLLKISSFAILLLAITACTEKIDIKLDETYTRLVVDGKILTDSIFQKITLSKTADYFYNQPIPMVVNAKVTVTDGENQYQFHETEPGVSGVYLSDIAFTGKTGKTYTLNVELEQPISDHSAFTGNCYLPGVTKLDSIGYQYHSEYGKEGAYLLTVYAMEPGNEKNFYMFHWYKNGILMNDSLDQLSISDDQFINGKYINGAAVMYVSNEHSWEKLTAGDTVMIRMSGITKEYYNYLMEIQLSQFNIPLFSGPPANVSSNINNGGVGFFTAYSSSFAKTVIK